MNKTLILSFCLVALFLIVSFFIYEAYRTQEHRHRCSDFKTQELAQGYYSTNKALYLDKDGDEVACESLG